MESKISLPIEKAVLGTNLYVGLEERFEEYFLSVYHFEGGSGRRRYDRLEGTAKDFYRLRQEIRNIIKSLRKDSVLRFSIWDLDKEINVRIRATDLIFGVGAVQWDTDPYTSEVGGKVCTNDIF